MTKQKPNILVITNNNPKDVEIKTEWDDKFKVYRIDVKLKEKNND